MGEETKSDTGTVNACIVASGNSRNVHLDIIKGFLVLTMFVYHSASGSGIAEVAFLRPKLQFLHYAFLLLAGFLCGSHYVAKVKVSPGKVQRRLMMRAVKLFAIVAVANVVFCLAGLAGDTDTLRQLLHSPLKVALFLDSNNNVAYELLYFIGVFLATCALVIRFEARAILAGAFVLLPCVIPGFTVWFVAYGYLGMLGGLFWQTDGFRRVVRWINDHSGLLFSLLAAEFVLLAPLSQFVPAICSITLETVLWFAAYVFVAKRFLTNSIQDWIILLGKYTLFAYIFHVVVVRITFKLLTTTGISGLACYAVLLGIVALVTFGSVWVLSGMRRFRVVDGLYRLAFA